MAAIVKAYHDTGFTGYVRPDHGRMIWGEQVKAGYGLYDRALGAVYLNGLWEAIDKFADQPPPDGPQLFHSTLQSLIAQPRAGYTRGGHCCQASRATQPAGRARPVNRVSLCHERRTP